VEKETLSTLNKAELLDVANNLFDELESVKSKLTSSEEKHATEIESLKKSSKETEDILNETIEELRGKLTETKKEVSVQKKTVKYEGNDYEVKINVFRHKGETFKADDLEKNSELLKELVEMEAGVLELIKK